MRPYDIHKIQPQTYDLKMIGDPNQGGAKKRSQSDIDKKKANVEKKNKQKADVKLGIDKPKDSTYFDIKEDANENSDLDSDGHPEDRYDPLQNNKEGVPRVAKNML